MSNVKKPDIKAWNKVKEMHSDGNGGGGDMGGGNFVTHKELELAKESIERKIEIVKSDISKDITMSEKSILENISGQLAEQNKQRKSEKTVTIRWIVGTSLTVIALILTATKYFIIG